MDIIITFLSALMLMLNIPNIAHSQTKQDSISEDCLPEYLFDGKKLKLTEKEWKERLTPEQFEILRKGGTEPSFNNAYWDNKKKGIYRCAGCDLPLFSSDKKFDAGTGWPSFWAPICPENVTLKRTINPLSSQREVICSRCEGHLGDRFNDGPATTYLRYCMDSAALKFIESK